MCRTGCWEVLGKRHSFTRIAYTVGSKSLSELILFFSDPVVEDLPCGIHHLELHFGVAIHRQADLELGYT
jgi:hypothetical protein